MLAPWAVRSVWIRVAGRNLAGERRGVSLVLKAERGDGDGEGEGIQYQDTGEHVTPARGGTKLLA